MHIEFFRLFKLCHLWLTSIIGIHVPNFVSLVSAAPRSPHNIDEGFAVAKVDSIVMVGKPGATPTCMLTRYEVAPEVSSSIAVSLSPHVYNEYVFNRQNQFYIPHNTCL